MIVKTYTGITLQEAVDKMKQELGEDALILSTKLLTSQEAASTGKKFEITACLDKETPAAKTKEPQKSKLDTPADINSELNRLRDRIYKTYNSSTETSEKKTASQPYVQSRVKDNSLQEELLDKEISPQVAKKILALVAHQAPFLKGDELNEYLKSTISAMIPVGSFGVKAKEKPFITAVIGPTGVGKTTCIAKLAVISKILHNLDVGLITLDTYRLGAIDQLKVFAQISSIDLLVAYQTKEIPNLLKQFRKKDIVFIDTAGRSQNNTEQLEEISTSLKLVKPHEVLLAVSSTGTTKHLQDVIKKFSPMKVSGLIYTKLDEAAAYGNILNVAVKHQVPIKFLTNGQVIPDDIIAADPDFIASMILTGKVV